MVWVRILCFLHMASEGFIQGNNCKEEISWVSKCSSIYHIKPFFLIMNSSLIDRFTERGRIGVLGAPVTKGHKLGGLKQQAFSL